MKPAGRYVGRHISHAKTNNNTFQSSNYSPLEEASEILKKLYGQNATFREGQYEAIEATINHHRTLVVQKTGWGKSLVYFICCALLKKKEAGMTIVISPLLSLMDNQLSAAKQLNLKCKCLNSRIDHVERKEIIASLADSSLDLLLITPENIFKDDVQSALKTAKISLFVVDEVHCISDWGHDFRLEYGKLHSIIEAFPENVRVLGTTATANDRVVKDLAEQFGKDTYISRGSLLRDNLYIQVLNLADRESRLAWMIDNIPKLNGSGIVYCLTRRDCEYVKDFLIQNGISADSYYSDRPDHREDEALELFKNNAIKVLVATIKLGMGYDKGDVAFVIHYQSPSNIVAYYQQIGRAGRNIEHAYTFLMTGKEDSDISSYFIENAFPSEEDLLRVRNAITRYQPVSKKSISGYCNLSNKKLEKVLNFLEHEGYVFFENSKYVATGKKFEYKGAYYDDIKKTRYFELEQMHKLQSLKACYNKYIVNSLGDNTDINCGFCANCVSKRLNDKPSPISFKKAQMYLNSINIPIEPRKRWPFLQDYPSLSNKNILFTNELGICLSKYGDPGYGQMVKTGKYAANPIFCEDLILKSAETLAHIVKANGIDAITFVPSLRSNIVEDFAVRLAALLKIRCISLLEKSPGEQQKRMENSSFQCNNALRTFSIKENTSIPEKVILVDDIIDSKWTLTVCGYLLKANGCEYVFPFALADSSQGE